jgi:hypothetical protein
LQAFLAKIITTIVIGLVEYIVRYLRKAIELYFKKKELEEGLEQATSNPDRNEAARRVNDIINRRV